MGRMTVGPESGAIPHLLVSFGPFDPAVGGGLCWLVMESWLRRLVSSLTALLVLWTSVQCVCQGAMAPAGGHEASATMEGMVDACCGGEGQSSCPMDHHRHQPAPGTPDHTTPDHSKPHDAACNHCQSSLAVDSSSTTHLNHFFDLAGFVPAWQAGGVHRIAAMALHARRFSGDLSPPVGPPTLLSLGCALNI